MINLARSSSYFRRTMQRSQTIFKQRCYVKDPVSAIPMSRCYMREKTLQPLIESEQERPEVETEDEEIFPHYCMTCEKEFLPYHHIIIYCSERLSTYPPTDNPRRIRPRLLFTSRSSSYEEEHVMGEASPVPDGVTGGFLYV
ncbi:hypothetical protein CC79DRAFT_916301 [Sarocladium strictum]